jgi:D-lactate dehydrogenase (cytochrome)
MYVTVGAGTKLTDIQAFLAKDSKQVPVASPWPDATVGGLVATNSNAPLRMRYGAIRDLVLCGTVALADGRVIRVGRPIVKNVAGYDLTKAFVGSYGTLGLMTDITLKIAVQPRAKLSLLYPVADLRHGLVWGRKLLPLALVSSALLLCKGHEQTVRAQFIAPPQSPYLLAYTAEGLSEDVQAELTQVREAMRKADAPDPVEVDSYTGTNLWAAMLAKMSEGVQVRVGVPSRELSAYVQDQSSTLMKDSCIADLGNGLVYATYAAEIGESANSWLAALRTSALAAQGYAIVTNMPNNMQSTLDRWGYQPEGLNVMRTLKKRWDPQSVLNKGMFMV